MTKNLVKKAIIILSIICLFLSGCQKKEPLMDFIELQPGSELLYNDKCTDYKLMSSIYCENSKVAFFNKSLYYNNLTNDFHLYRLSNYISLIYDILGDNVDLEQEERICDYLDSMIGRMSQDELDFYEIRDVASIVFYIGSESNKNAISDYLLEAFDENLGMFLCSDDETELDQINSTNIVLQTFEYLGFIPSSIETKLKSKLDELLCDSNYFTFEENEIELNIFDGGMTILETCVIFNSLSAIENIDISCRSDWFSFWAGKFCSQVDNNEFNLIIANTGLIKILRIAECFQFDVSIFNYLVTIQTGNMVELLSQDPKETYECLYLLKKFKQPMPDISTSIYNYQLFIYNTTPDVRIKEQYYGYKVSELLGFEINRELLSSLLAENLSEDSTLEDLFFCLLLTQEIGDLSFLSDYEMLYKTAFQKNKIEITQPTALSSTYYTLYIGCHFNWLSDNDINHIEVVLTEFMQQSSLEQDIYWYTMIFKLLGIDLDGAAILLDIKSYFYEDGYAISKKDPELVNILSTYRMLVATQNLGEDLGIEFLQEFLKKYQGNAGGYFMVPGNGVASDYKDNFTLQSWYYGLVLSTFID